MITGVLADLVPRKKALVREPAMMNRTSLSSAISFQLRSSVYKSALGPYICPSVTLGTSSQAFYISEN